MLGNLLAVLFALASALVIAWGTVIRHRIVLDADSTSVMRTAVVNPLWWVGTGGAVVAYAFQLLALGFGTLLIVQPILMLKLMFTLPLSAWYARHRMPAHEVFWCVALTIAVGFLVVYGRPTAGTANPSLAQWGPSLTLGALTLAGLAGIAYRRRSDRALALGTACGVIYGYVALMAKVAVDTLHHGGVVAMLASWQFYLLVGLAGAGTVVQQYSFHAGALKKSLPAMTIMEPIVAFGLGYWVLGEKFQVSSWLGWAVMALALAVMIAATIVLSRLPVPSARTATA